MAESGFQPCQAGSRVYTYNHHALLPLLICKMSCWYVCLSRPLGHLVCKLLSLELQEAILTVRNTGRIEGNVQAKRWRLKSWWQVLSELTYPACPEAREIHGLLTYVSQVLPFCFRQYSLIFWHLQGEKSWLTQGLWHPPCLDFDISFTIKLSEFANHAFINPSFGSNSSRTTTTYVSFSSISPVPSTQ